MKERRVKLTTTGHSHEIEGVTIKEEYQEQDIKVLQVKENVKELKVYHDEHGEVVIPVSEDDAILSITQKEVNPFGEIQARYD